MSDARTETLADILAVVRHGVNEAMVLSDIATHAGDKTPFSGGYDDVHDAMNAIWHASRALDRLPQAIREARQAAWEEALEEAAQVCFKAKEVGGLARVTLGTRIRALSRTPDETDGGAG